MNKKRELSNKARIYHRYLGFFLAGIMAVYAISGVVLIFRDTDFLKKEYTEEKKLEVNLNQKEVGSAIGIRNLKFEGKKESVLTFKGGTYNSQTGMAIFTKKRLPLVLDKMTHLHKAKSADPLYFLNIFFGVGLLFFVLSSFWMFLPNTTIFKKGLYFTAAGAVLVIILLMV